MNQKTLTLLAYGIPTLLVSAVLAFTILRPIQVLPRIGLGPGYGLQDPGGTLITNEKMRGKLVLYSFTYTHCQTNCPRLMEKMQTVHSRLGEVTEALGPLEFEMVTISIDPERDTPERLAQYAATYRAAETAPSWHFVTGANPKLLKIMVSSGFDLYHEKVSPKSEPSSDDYQFKFVPMAVLIDGWGIIRAEYRQYESAERLSYSDGTSDIDPDIVLRDIGLVASEANNSKGAAKAAYGAAHLFLCYPP